MNLWSTDAVTEKGREEQKRCAALFGGIITRLPAHGLPRIGNLGFA